MDSIIYLVNCLIKQIDSIIYLVYCFIKQYRFNYIPRFNYIV